MPDPQYNTYVKIVADKITYRADDVSFVMDAVNSDVQEKVGDVVRKVDKTGWLREKIGDYTKQVKNGAEKKESPLGMLSKVGTTRQAILQNMSLIESGLMKFAQSASGTEIGSDTAGMQMTPGGVNIKFNPSTCYDIGKAIDELFKLIAILKDLFDKIKDLVAPALNLGPLNALGEFNIPCLDINTGASALVDSLDEALSATIEATSVPSVNASGD